MRKTKLTAALIGAAASLTLSCAAASAAFGHVHRRHFGVAGHGCRVTLAFKETVVTKGEAAVAAGQLACVGSEELAAEPVTLYERVAGTSSFTPVASGTTEAKTGAYSIEVKGLERNGAFYAATDGVRSVSREEKVFAEVKLEGPPEGVQPTTLRHRPEATFTGTVSPQDPNTVAVLQRQNIARGEQWFSFGKPVPVVNGKFTIKHAFTIPGAANLRVVVHTVRYGRPALNAPSASNILSYEIAQAQNPELLIDSSANPISYGQSTTISGTVEKAPAGTHVRLLAHAAHEAQFTPIAETETKEGGVYSFEKLTPLVGTFYRVQADGKTSAILYQGVKYLLTSTVEPKATTIPQGQKLVFSGDVKPGMGIEGHPVYLERENAAHIGFHVIALGEVLPPNTTDPEYHYEIPYYLFKPGTSVLRVRIPGDPQNSTTSSEKLTFQVTRESAAQLLGEPTENPKLPSEGQL
ncbi:MAG TPA: hypothetical protein VKV16_00290 [Solirubrobacteraceae bacterium]|nr:hypothetical protein [Solirubrobacteraceae bacterium]